MDVPGSQVFFGAISPEKVRPFGEPTSHVRDARSAIARNPGLVRQIYFDLAVRDFMANRC